MTSDPENPGGARRRPLHFFWLVDCSGSMQGSKILALNAAIREALPELCDAVADKPDVEVLMRAIRFSSTADWHVGPEPVALEQFAWPELEVDTLSDTGQALELLCGELDISKMPRRGSPPVILLISDGYASDTARYHAALQQLLSLPWGKRAVRLAIGVGQDHELDEDELRAFNIDPKRPLLRARKGAELVQKVKAAAIAATLASLKVEIEFDDDGY